MRIWAFAIVMAIGLGPQAAVAQEAQTLADIRQELNVLFVEIQRLKRELSTTGGSGTQVGGGSTLERANAIEGELQRLTGKIEQLEYRINRVVADGTNRIGDLEFRLVELEGGDVSQLGQTTTLGGEAAAQIATTPVPAEQDGTSLAIGERTDFERASAALAAGEFRGAADQFAAFRQAYPGGPLEVQAALSQGAALDGLGDTRSAARAFLDAFSHAPEGEAAPDALTRLGVALGKLGQTDEACLTLTEVEVRFPDASEVATAQAEMRRLGCS